MNYSDDEFLQCFGRRLTNLRKAAGFTSQERFAYHCEMSRVYIGDVERGKRNPSLLNVQRIAASLGFTIEEFFEGFDTDDDVVRSAKLDATPSDASAQIASEYDALPDYAKGIVRDALETAKNVAKLVEDGKA